MRYLLTISYDGHKFHGFQRQKNLKNVQKTLEDALSNLLQESIVIKGSGRTDALVHALGQTCHFDTTTKIKARFKEELNQYLQGDIVIKRIKKVGNTFHARHSAIGKHYVYKINLGQSKPELEGYVYQPKFPIDLHKLKEIKALFLGRHDFHNFVSGKRLDYQTTIYKINIKKRDSILEIHFYGRAFYRYMVRNLVGAMLDYNKGKVSLAELSKMLNDENYEKQLSTAPAYALYLVKVYY